MRDLFGKTRVNKYNNVRTGKYASAAESARAAELWMLQRAGKISDLVEQFNFLLIPAQGNLKPVHYRADFVYRRDGQMVVEDAKGVATQVYVLKKKLMKLVHNIDIVEIKR